MFGPQVAMAAWLGILFVSALVAALRGDRVRVTLDRPLFIALAAGGAVEAITLALGGFWW